MPAVDLRFGQPAPTDADLLFGADFVAPRNEITVQATLPLPLAALLFTPNARLDLYAALPTPTVLALLRPSVPLVLGGATGAALYGTASIGSCDSLVSTPASGASAGAYA